MIVPIMTYERSTLVNSEKYIGLDVHQATISVAVMDPRGKVVMESILAQTDFIRVMPWWSSRELSAEAEAAVKHTRTVRRAYSQWHTQRT